MDSEERSGVDEWEIVRSRQVGDYRVFNVREDRRRSPRTGAEHDFYVLQMPEWVNVIALTPERRVVIIEQYRHGIQAVGVEIPGGMVDAEDAVLAEAAGRELEEETGYVAREIVGIGSVTANPAIQNNQLHTFVALGCQKMGTVELEAAEDIAVREVELDAIPDLIGSGRMNHALVIAGFYWFDRWSRENEDVLRQYDT
ncbi:MAG: NUDIX hydrolase [Gemmatimonadetes bacterium]|nr:NUDIX hydrolase [Gemmatimonadota bacterium]MBT7860289.1 NUDIX hydrolase [Gemmatimonadota bacterium]